MKKELLDIVIKTRQESIPECKDCLDSGIMCSLYIDPITGKPRRSERNIDPENPSFTITRRIEDCERRPQSVAAI